MTAAENPLPKLPPVESWNPAFCGDSHMRIARDGSWFHEGAPITRPELVKVGENVRQLCKKHNVRFLHISPNTDPSNPFFVNREIDEGVMVFESDDVPTAIMGREHSKRKMPV